MTGQELRDIRERLGLTQSQLGARLGVTRRTIYRMERHLRLPLAIALAVGSLKTGTDAEAA